MIILNNEIVPVAKFPAGEIRINVKALDINEIELKFEGSDDIIALQMICDAIKQQGKEPNVLIMRYVPYGRQDRVCNTGESFSLEVFAKTINELKFGSVIIQDPHSWQQVTMIDNSVVVPQSDTWLDAVKTFSKTYKDKNTEFTLVSPDAGAKKKIETLSCLSDISSIYCDKVRDPKTGRLSDFTVQGDQKLNGVYCIVDDICDGGGTFIGLAKELKRLGASKVLLCCTHGIFSKGIDCILEEVDEIYTTDSLMYYTRFSNNEKFKVIYSGYFEETYNGN